MMKKKWILLLGVFLVVACASSAFAVSLKRLGTSPFSPPMNSEADLRTMVGNNSADLQAGFVKAGYPELFSEFKSQFPTAQIDTIRVNPGERLNWMLFRKNKGKGPVTVVKDVSWDGDAAFDAYRFYIDKDGQRYEFVVPADCGNLSLRSVGPVPVVKAAAPPPPPPVVAPEPVKEPVVVERRGGPVVDAGLAYQPDPASYAFARVGYEFPLTDRLTVMGLIGGFILIDDDDDVGDDAFIADVLLTYYINEKLFVGGGAGYWSGNDGEVDLIVNMGYLVYENPGVMRTSIFIEGRCEADNLISSSASRVGAGVRFQF